MHSDDVMIMVMMCTSVSSYARPFVVRCMGVWPRWVGYGLGWVMGPQVHLGVGIGLGWVSYLVGWVGFGSMKWTRRQHSVYY